VGWREGLLGAAVVCKGAVVVKGSEVGAKGGLQYAAVDCGKRGGRRVSFRRPGVISGCAGSAVQGDA
jgi:hypothetical protein